MGGAINRSFISAHFLLSAYFLTAWTYKHMRLTTQIYGISFLHVFAEHACLILHCYQYSINPFRPHSAMLTTLGSYVIILYNETVHTH